MLNPLPRKRWWSNIGLDVYAFSAFLYRPHALFNCPEHVKANHIIRGKTAKQLFDFGKRTSTSSSSLAIPQPSRRRSSPWMNFAQTGVIDYKSARLLSLWELLTPPVKCVVRAQERVHGSVVRKTLTEWGPAMLSGAVHGLSDDGTTTVHTSCFRAKCRPGAFRP